MQSTVLDRLAERVVLEAELLGDLLRPLSCVEQLLGTGEHVRSEHRWSANFAGLIEAINALFLKLPNAACPTHSALFARTAGPPESIVSASRCSRATSNRTSTG